MQTTKFTQDEIREIQVIKENYDQITLAFGQFHIKQQELLSIEADLNASYSSIRAKEKEFLSKIVEKYGEGTFDPVSGIFTKKEST